MFNGTAKEPGVKLSQRLQDERSFVERSLGNLVICQKCGASLGTYADACTADLAEQCPGFLAIEKSKKLFAASRMDAERRSSNARRNEIVECCNYSCSSLESIDGFPGCCNCCHLDWEEDEWREPVEICLEGTNYYVCCSVAVWLFAKKAIDDAKEKQ